jgi:chromosome segregation ATPase
VERATSQINDANSGPVEVEQIVSSSGEIELSPILKQLNVHESKIGSQNDRRAVLETRTTVHAPAVQNLHDKANQNETDLKETKARLVTCENDHRGALSALAGTVKLQGHRIVDLDERLIDLAVDVSKRSPMLDKFAALPNQLQEQYSDVSHEVEESAVACDWRSQRPEARSAARGRENARTGDERPENECVCSFDDRRASLPGSEGGPGPDSRAGSGSLGHAAGVVED